MSLAFINALRLLQNGLKAKITSLLTRSPVFPLMNLVLKMNYANRMPKLL
jgi:hypothetical protein